MRILVILVLTTIVIYVLFRIFKAFSKSSNSNLNLSKMPNEDFSYTQDDKQKERILKNLIRNLEEGDIKDKRYAIKELKEYQRKERPSLLTQPPAKKNECSRRHSLTKINC